MLLEVSGIDCYYDENRVLENITFSVDHGESFGVIGPNASGKTTLLKCISGRLKPRSGSVLLNGVDTKTLSAKEVAKKMAIVSQTSHIDFDFTGQEIVAMGRNPYISRFRMENQEDYKIVERAMKLTDTGHLASRLASNLSGGELQRIIIARALAQEPKLILLDEPTVHLDISHQLEIMELIKRLNTENELTVISVFHNLNLVAQYCKRLMLLDSGRILSIGTPPEVLTSENIQKTYHVNVLIKKHPLTSALYVIPFTSTIYRRGLSEARIHMICGGGSGSSLMKLLQEKGYELTAGVINVLDSDYETATSLNIPIVDEAPFSEITRESHRRNLQLVFGSHIVILADIVLGKGNLKNLKAAKKALDKGIPLILVESTPFEEKNFAGKSGERLYSYLRQKAILVHKPENVPNIIDSIKRR